MAIRYISDRGVGLATELNGRELASPRRRGAAFILDMLIIAVPSIALTILVAWAAFSIREPVALKAMKNLLSGKADTKEATSGIMRDLVPLMVKYEMPGTPAQTIAAFEAGDLDLAVASLEGFDLMISLNRDTSAATAGNKWIYIELDRLIPPALKLITFYGLAALYYSWFLSRRSGATLGKRWLGIRVIRLDNNKLTLLESFERFVGYFQIPASFGTALLDFWRDPNRRLPHDRLSGTLVIKR